MAAVNDTMGILAKRVEELSRRLAQYRGITDVEAEIASKQAAYARQHNEKVEKLKQKVEEARAAIRKEYDKARQAQEKAVERGKAIIARAKEHAERIKREAGDEVFREYEKLGDERAAVALEKDRVLDEARAQADKLLVDARTEAEKIVAEARSKAEIITVEAQPAALPQSALDPSSRQVRQVSTPPPQTESPALPRERPKKKKGRRR